MPKWRVCYTCFIYLDLINRIINMLGWIGFVRALILRSLKFYDGCLIWIVLFMHLRVLRYDVLIGKVFLNVWWVAITKYINNNCFWLIFILFIWAPPFPVTHLGHLQQFIKLCWFWYLFLFLKYIIWKQWWFSLSTWRFDVINIS